jgi:hypothetical protein
MVGHPETEPKRFLSGTILVRDSEAGAGTEFTVVQKYGKQDSGTTEYLPSPQGRRGYLAYRLTARGHARLEYFRRSGTS